ncbi:MAG TPA: peptidase C1 [Flavobacteriales bacterium]|nr:peptidase C1 [Flavobacteriales bacterium]
MKRIAVIASLFWACGTTVTEQPAQNTGVFTEYENKFYDEIKKELNAESSEKKDPKMVFKMNYSAIDIPMSIDEFTTVWCNDPLSQGRTGTCWSFGASSFYETEIQRLTKQKIKLSELFIVYWEYVEKAREFVATKGESRFTEGSQPNAVTRMIKLYGMVPADYYSGKKEGQKYHDHKPMYKKMSSYLVSLKEDSNWVETQALIEIKLILDDYLGAPPTEIKYNGEKMSPIEFRDNIIKINPDDYVDFMSMLEAPYFEKAEYDVPDNWWHNENYNNVPLDDFMELIDYAVVNGYSVALGGDVSESGISADNDVAMIPSYDIPSAFINEHARQLRFKNGSTTDDHIIHLVGYLKKNGENWYLIKDSGSSARNGNNKGYYFYHEDFIKLKTLTFTVHKDAAVKLLSKMR